jgi:hypothetical protein
LIESSATEPGLRWFCTQNCRKAAAGLLLDLEERLLEGRTGDVNGVKLMRMGFTTLLLFKYSLELDFGDYK